MTAKPYSGKRCVCDRCLHDWYSIGRPLPLVCPKCKSPYWNRSRKGEETIFKEGIPIIRKVK